MQAGQRGSFMSSASVARAMPNTLAKRLFNEAGGRGQWTGATTEERARERETEFPANNVEVWGVGMPVPHWGGMRSQTPTAPPRQAAWCYPHLQGTTRTPARWRRR